jgi:phage tail-like protein
MATDRVSSYLTHLPALFHEDAFVGRFLLAFERILSGLQPRDPDEPRLVADAGADEQPPGIEEIIDQIHTYFIPGPQLPAAERAPTGFLSWLASWVALSVREDWEEEEKRRFISRIVSLYKHRGTKYGLEQILETYTGEEAVIYEFDQPPHYFQVEMTLSEPTPAGLRRKERIARAIIDQEKPAHTFYALRILVPTMRIINADPDRGIRVGQNTLLGTTAGRGGA